MDYQNEILSAIAKEREYQKARWGTEFDSANTINDWVAYIAKYLGKAVTAAATSQNDPQDITEFRRQLIKVATLCVAAAEQDSYAPRHYDLTESV